MVAETTFGWRFLLLFFLQKALLTHADGAGVFTPSTPFGYKARGTISAFLTAPALVCSIRFKLAHA